MQSTRGRGSKTDVRWDHDVVAVLLWTAAQPSIRADVDERAMAQAAEKVVERVAGVAGQPRRWWAIGAAKVAPPTPAQLLSWGDLVGGVAAAYQLTVSYRVSELA